ncbi:MAG: glutamine-hydrolyzing GMP synthase [Candidatus Peribacteraceae bacterium]|nr:glutamine-hydrolyzing GMP synthase [Candidatus Peribacteraceae bacterium]
MELRRSIVILDFGGQYAHLIARRVRQLGAYSEIRDPSTPAKDLKEAAGIILSGGPQSVYDTASPAADPKIFSLGIPVLGICYGLQWMTKALGGTVTSGKVKEYGHTEIRAVNGGGILLKDIGDRCSVWMSHGDEASVLPEGFQLTALSDSCVHAAFEDPRRKFFAVQFHPEVTHTEHGMEILRRFVELCPATPWSVSGFAKRIGDEIAQQVQDRRVFMLVSGGVDSTVAFVLLNEVLGAHRVQGLLIDTGLMRKNEIAEIRAAFEKLGVTNVRIEDASADFFATLEGVIDPEEKRRAIGDTFLAVQKRVSEELGLTGDDGWLANRSAAASVDDGAAPLRRGYGGQPSLHEGWILGQGTIYPDTIETKGTRHADHIKTHHNRVPAIQEMLKKGLVIEPLKELYKDEVRLLGEELGLPHELVERHPFPGPGLGVRILCADKPDTLSVDDVGIKRWAGGWAVLPVKSVGVQGDGRTYRHALALFSQDPCGLTEQLWRLATEIPNRRREFNRVLLCTSSTEARPFTFSPGAITQERTDLLREADAIVTEEMRRAGLYEKIWQFPVVLLPFGSTPGGQSVVLRPVESQEAMTARAAVLPAAVLKRMTERIMGLTGIDFVFYDLTSKPPATIEWE